MSGKNGTWATLMSRHSEMRDLSLDDLRVDMRFQRAVNPNSLKRIKAEYHPAGIGHILVAGVPPRNPGEPRYAVIDGQTRYQALLALLEAQKEGAEVAGLQTTIRAEVYPELSVEEAALLFRLRNAQRPVPPKDRDRIALTEGNPEMQEVIAQAADAGYVVFSEDDDIPETMPAIEVAKRLIVWGKRHKRPHLLAEALAIQAEAFRVPESADLRGTIHPQILQATADLLRKNANLVESELARVMRTQADLLFDSERRVKKDQIRMHKAVQLVLRDRYNVGKDRKDRIRV